MNFVKSCLSIEVEESNIYEFTLNSNVTKKNFLEWLPTHICFIVFIFVGNTLILAGTQRRNQPGIWPSSEE